ncbi:uncharacterized protein VTP21DRAFT_6780 [Calcarisporiella thermophila]|uniref:uncharacterized protein n=1 Tax=Calcarisporiella thermophila TaxID=911321 RepID=UPI00374449DE
MRKLHSFLLLFILSLLSSSSTAVTARVSPSEHAAKLNSLKTDGLIPLDSKLFTETIASPRAYGLVVLLTAMDDRFNCVPCRDVDPEYRLLAKSWEKAKDNNRLLFTILDFNQGQEVYAKMKLTTAPNLFYFPPTEGSYAGHKSGPVRYDLNKGNDAESLAEFLTDLTGISVRVRRPLSYSLLLSVCTLLIGPVIAYVFFRSLLEKFFLSRNTWAVLTITIIFTMVSGYMWNQIRKPPYFSAQKGGISYIAPGYQNQFGIESQIIAILYAICAACALALALVAPKIQRSWLQRILIYSTMCVLLLGLSTIFKLFSVKQPSYPFRFFP